ncbi:MAG: DegT/DnrJ/EryC1/StrS family aminotransferase [Hymenobacter sp.]|nr:MAG: DegT/DnrJ/EryC1/StrS family aminotransferase [Hymenobacter sp.]
MLTVTKTFFPPLDDYHALLRRVWATGQVTNNGPLVVELEETLKKHLGVKNLLYVSNGTLALQLAIRALGLQGEVITTPFSYVATTSSLVWENCRPVFVDVDPGNLCLDPRRIEAAITPATQAILATHVFGFACDVEAIEAIARRHGLHVLYDAAHAFGVRHRGRPLLHYGDVSTLSFHATKVFHTGEGGAIVTSDDALAERLGYLRNFGHIEADTFAGLGINAKNTELHAALGLCVLPHLPALLAHRHHLTQLYHRLLAPYCLQRLTLTAEEGYNFSYYPVLLASEERLLAVLAALQAADIYPRRYFYPSLTTLPYVAAGAACPVAHDAASRVLCLPLHHELTPADVARITTIIGQHA